MSNVCYLAVILIFFGGYLVTACYLVITACSCSFHGDHCSLLVVTCLLPLVPTFSMNAITYTLEKNIFAAATFKDL